MEYGCIGEKLGHSFSKEIHAILADYKYELCEIPLDKLDEFMKKAEFKAINVTIPYKERVMPYLDYVCPEAEKIGAVNTVVNREGRLLGYNTDYAGMKALIERAGIEIKNKNVLILGTGGTSKTALAVVNGMGAKKAVKASRTAKEGCITYDEAYAAADTEVIINTTPLGMYPNTEAVPLDLKRFSHLSGVVDAVYNPIRTELVSCAREMGVPSSGGLYMLVAQAVYACEYFIGEKKSEREIEEAYKKILAEKENIVLIGMPGSGKTTIGKIIADKLSRRFIDLDEEIKAEEGMEPSEIINKYGEEKFRAIEKTAAKKAASVTGAVIATGGGTVIDPENVRALKRNGKIIFINRDIEKIKPTASRPLSSDREMLKKRFAERFEIYKYAADKTIVPGDRAAENADAIIKEMAYENTCD